MTENHKALEAELLCAEKKLVRMRRQNQEATAAQGASPSMAPLFVACVVQCWHCSPWIMMQLCDQWLSVRWAHLYYTDDTRAIRNK
eukprot:3537743-Rhodomonas_salina.1